MPFLPSLTWEVLEYGRTEGLKHVLFFPSIIMTNMIHWNSLRTRMGKFPCWPLRNHDLYLDNNLDILGGLHLFGCYPVHITQSNRTGCYKVPQAYFLWWPDTIPYSWGPGSFILL